MTDRGIALSSEMICSATSGLSTDAGSEKSDESLLPMVAHRPDRGGFESPQGEIPGRAGLINPTDTADTLRLREEVSQMKQRIQVLERVITDNHRAST